MPEDVTYREALRQAKEAVIRAVGEVPAARPAGSGRLFEIAADLRDMERDAAAVEAEHAQARDLMSVPAWTVRPGDPIRMADGTIGPAVVDDGGRVYLNGGRWVTGLAPVLVVRGADRLSRAATQERAASAQAGDGR